MDIWIIRDGKRAGPIHDYEIRRRIEDNQIDPTTPAWHEGLGEWRPLSEIELFRSEFEKSSGNPDMSRETDHDPPPQDPAPSPTPSAPATSADGSAAFPPQTLIRRFWARWFDLILFAGFWWLAMWGLGRDIGATLDSPWVMVLQYVPWFILESILLHYLGTTPGKWLLGISVRNVDGTSLSLAASTRRSVRVLVMGIGFGWSFLALFCQVLSFFTARRLGNPLWDHVGGHRVIAARLHPLRIAIFALLFFGAMQLQMIVLYPYMAERAGRLFPEMKERLEENPQWHLPRRGP